MQFRFNAWARWAVARGPTSIGPHAYLCMFCTVCFSNLVCLILYTFTVLQVPMSGCVGMGPSALLCPGARDAVKTALLLLLLSKKQ